MHFNRDELKGLPFTFPTTIHRYINAFHSQTEGIGIRIICVVLYLQENMWKFC
jgi:hypothetical protein